MNKKFKCERCGACCSGRTGIGWVEIYRADILKWKKAKLWEKVILPKLNTIDSLSPTGFIIDFDEHNEHCPFLDGLLGNPTCILHEQYGRIMKPQMCISFPNKKNQKFCNGFLIESSIQKREYEI